MLTLLARWFYYMVHPRAVLRRARELRRGRQKGEVRRNPIHALPEVDLICVNGQPELEEAAILLFQRNPSKLVTCPMVLEELAAEIQKGACYYLIVDAQGDPVGCIGWQSWRNMVVHVIVDFERRSGGLSLAAVVKLMELKRSAGERRAHAQVYSKNWRAQNLFISLGFTLDEGQDPDVGYFSYTCDLATFKVPQGESA